MSLFTGTSGFAYPAWKGAFYPEKLPQSRFLEHYATRLPACEINATFYRMPAPGMLAKWSEAVPPGFRFAVKAFRGITPMNTELGLLRDFIATAQDALRDSLGVVLLQQIVKREGREEMLGALLDSHGSQVPLAVDLKHPSWAGDDVAAMLAEHGATACYTDTTGTPPASLPPGPVAYVRLRAGTYDASARRDWAALLAREAGARDVYVFVKHDDAPAGSPDQGVGLAEWLASLPSRPA